MAKRETGGADFCINLILDRSETFRRAAADCGREAAAAMLEQETLPGETHAAHACNAACGKAVNGWCAQHADADSRVGAGTGLSDKDRAGDHPARGGRWW